MFRKQMEMLAELGWRTVLPGDIRLNSAEHSGCDRRFLLAFDDGYECIHRYAFPVFERLGFRAAVFVPSGFIGKWATWDHQLLGRRFRHLSREMLLELNAAGWMVGSHTISHTSLIGLDDRHLQRELTDSREFLQELLGAAVDWVAFPFGRYNIRVLEAALRAGYRGAVTPVLHRANSPGGFTLWPADAVYRWDSVRSIRRRLNRGTGYRTGRILRRGVNFLSGGTVIWRRLFPR